MAAFIRKGKKAGLTADKLAHLQDFITSVKKGEAVPFEEKTRRAAKNLSHAGLLK
jgi:hypothetical protein